MTIEDLLYCGSYEEKLEVSKMILSHYPNAKINDAPKPLGLCDHRISVSIDNHSYRKYKILIASRGYGDISLSVSIMVAMSGQSEEKYIDAKRFVEEMKLNVF